jgi:hypothetical protein
MELLLRDGNVGGWVDTGMGDASLQKVSAIREKLIWGRNDSGLAELAGHLAGFTIQKVGAGVMELRRLTDSSANWNLAALIG